MAFRNLNSQTEGLGDDFGGGGGGLLDEVSTVHFPQ